MGGFRLPNCEYVPRLPMVSCTVGDACRTTQVDLSARDGLEAMESLRRWARSIKRDVVALYLPGATHASLGMRKPLPSQWRLTR